MNGPPIYLTSAEASVAVDRRCASVAERASVGSAGVYAIARYLRRQHWWPRVLAFTPPSRLITRLADGEAGLAEGLDPEAYADALRRLWARNTHRHRPDVLRYAEAGTIWRPGTAQWDGETWRDGDIVEPSATLVSYGPLGSPDHRLIVAEHLAAAGWRVVLDGRPFRAMGRPSAATPTPRATPAMCTAAGTAA